MQSDTTGSLQEFYKILEEAGKKGASDIHYVPKEQLLLRIDGRLVDMTEEWNVSFSMEELIEELLDKKQQKTFEENGEVEFSCPVFNKRVRVNLFRQSGTCAMSVRLFAEKIPTPQMLGLPESAVQMAGKRRGLILVTGASGSGRTTTMASMIDHIASNYERSILTLEKPAEYLFRSGKSMVLQREIGIDSRSYEAGLKAALKQDMDVILISEMEDLDTVSLALTAAEMGHLVIAALPTQNAVASIERIVECFQDHRQHQIRSQLSDVLAGVISQQLLPRLDGGGGGAPGPADDAAGIAEDDRQQKGPAHQRGHAPPVAAGLVVFVVLIVVWVHVWNSFQGKTCQYPEDKRDRPGPACAGDGGAVRCPGASSPVFRQCRSLKMIYKVYHRSRRPTRTRNRFSINFL